MGSSIYADNTESQSEIKIEATCSFKANLTSPPKPRKLRFGDKVRITHNDDNTELGQSIVGADVTFQGNCWTHNGRRYRGSHEHFPFVAKKFKTTDGKIVYDLYCSYEPIAK